MATPALRIRIAPKFPTKIQGSGGITIDRTGGVVTINGSGVRPAATIDEMREGIDNSKTVTPARSAQAIFEQVFPTRAELLARDLPAVQTRVRTSGYNDPDDRGGADHQWVPSLPSHDGWFQTPDGRYWEICERVVTPEMFGAKGDLVTDDADAIRKCGEVAKAIGATALIAGAYRIASNISPSVAVEYHGVGWYMDESTEPHHAKGSVFFIDTPGFNVFDIQQKAGAHFHNIAFEWAHDAPASGWAPTSGYGWAIRSASGKLIVADCMFLGVTKGVRVEVTTVGQVPALPTFRNNWAHNFGVLFDIDVCADTNRILHTHAWAFWSQSQYVTDWTTANSIAILSGANDGPVWHDLFAWGHLSAVDFKIHETPISIERNTQRFEASNIFGDFSKHLVRCPVDLVTGNFTKSNHQGSSLMGGETSILVSGNDCTITFTDFFGSITEHQSLCVIGLSNTVEVNGTYIADRFGRGTADAAIDIASGNVVRFGKTPVFRLGGGGYSTRRIAATGSSGIQLPARASFRAKNGSTQTIATATPVTLAWPSEDFDNEGGFDTVTGRFTPRLPGIYRIRAGVGWSTTVDNTSFELRILLNGATVLAVDRRNAAGTGQMTLAAERLILLNGETDYVTVVAAQFSGGDRVIQADSTVTFFEGART